MNRNDISTIVAVVAPFEDMRRQMREVLGECYIQVYLDCPVEECAKRDVKGYYKKKEKMENFSGVSDTFEIPENSELVIDTVHLTVEESVEKIVGYLKKRGYCP